MDAAVVALLCGPALGIGLGLLVRAAVWGAGKFRKCIQKEEHETKS